MKLKLGLFAFNSTGGLSLLKKNLWSANGNKIENLIKKAEKNSFNFILPLSKFTGWKGKTNPHGFAYETFVMSAGLLNITKKINIISTIHIPFTHPVHAAKICKSLIAINKGKPGRIYLNLVAGVVKSDLEIFNLGNFKLREKYKISSDWIKLFKKSIMAKKPFNANYKHFKGKNIVADINYKVKEAPKIVSAGYSPEGKSFALNNCDYQFTFFNNLERSKEHNLKIKQEMRKSNKNIKLLTNLHIVSGNSRHGVKRNFQKYFKLIDNKSVKTFYDNLTKNNPKLKNILKLDNKLFSSIGLCCGSYLLVGTPKEIVEKFSVIKKSGFYGVAISFCDYKNDFDFFCKNILPSLKRKKIV